VSRDTIDDDIYKAGYVKSMVQIEHQDNAFMTTILFEKWIEEVFLPEVREKRDHYGYRGKGILIMDGFGGHKSEKITALCKADDISIKYLIPHTSHMTQPLDLLTFASLKHEFRNIHIDCTMSEQSKKILKLMHAWTRATVVHHVVATFRGAGIASNDYTSAGFYNCHINLHMSLKLRDIEKLIEVQQTIEHEIAATHPSIEEEKTQDQGEVPHPVTTRKFTPRTESEEVQQQSITKRIKLDSPCSSSEISQHEKNPKWSHSDSWSFNMAKKHPKQLTLSQMLPPSKTQAAKSPKPWSRAKATISSKPLTDEDFLK
jgi:hypothetical protein